MCGKELTPKHVVFVIVSVVCSIVFLCKAWECVLKFTLHHHVTKLDVDSPQNHPELPMPKICISLGFNANALKSLNITSREYRGHGVWKNEQNKSENEEEVYNRVENDVTDVIDQVTIRVNTGDGGGYTTHTIYENGTDVKMWKMEQYCDFYYDLKCICTFIKPWFSQKGVQQIRIFLKKSNKISKKVKLAVISPGHYYGRQLKINGMDAWEGFEYKYNIVYVINQALSKTSSPCTHQSNWMLDKCKLKYLVNLLLSHYNCTVPWLLAFARY